MDHENINARGPQSAINALSGDVSPRPGAMGFPCFAITAQALYTVRRDMALYALPHSGGQARKIISVPPFDSGGHLTWETRFTVSPDDSTLVWVRVAPQEIDLEMRKLP